MKKLGELLRANGIAMSIHNNTIIFSKKGGNLKMFRVDPLVMEKATDDYLENVLVRYLEIYLNSFNY